MSLQRAAVRSVGLTGGTLDLVIGVYNPNPFDLQGTRLQLGLDVEDSHVGDVDYSSEFQAQKGDTTVLTLPLSFTWNGLAAAARTALGTGELPYTLKGQLSVTTPIGATAGRLYPPGTRAPQPHRIARPTFHRALTVGAEELSSEH